LVVRHGLAALLHVVLQVATTPVLLVAGGVQTLLLAPGGGELLAGASGVHLGGGQLLGGGLGVALGLIDRRVQRGGEAHLLVVEAAELVGPLAGGGLLVLDGGAAISECSDFGGEVALLAL